MNVTLADAEPNALTAMLSDLLTATAARPAPCCVGVRAVDLGLSTTVELSRSGATLGNGIDKARVRVRLRGEAASLIALGDAPSLAGIPNPFTATGRAALGLLLRRRIRIKGALRHPLDLLRFSRACGGV